MPSPQTLDLELLLVPIPGGNPAGESLRYAGPYDAIQEARRADDVLEQGDWKRETKAADWHAVIAITTEALAAKSKDMQIAAWLIEALVKRQGFPGLRDGLKLLRELQQEFWPSLYPEVEDGDMEFRASPLEWLNEKLPPSIRAIPVTHSSGGEEYSWMHWEQSRSVDNLGRQDQEAMAAALAEGKITGEQFDKAVAATSRAYYETLFEDLNQSWEEYQQLDRVVDEKFGREAPSLLGIKKAIDDCRTLAEGIVKKKRELEPDLAPPPQPEPEPKPERGLFDRLLRRKENTTPSGPERRPNSSLPFSDALPLEPQDRNDALRRLAAVALYFRRTEPHSPISFLVERAIRWGEMPFEEWLKDVIHSEDVLSQIRETLGLKSSDQE